MKILNANCGEKNYLAIKKRGQFKIQRMVFMLLAVVFFFVLVGMFWVSIQSQNIHKRATELMKEQAFMVSTYIISSPEFSCIYDEYCIDTDKLMALMNNTAYKDFWPVSYIKVRKLGYNKEVVCNKANYPNCSLFNIYENKKIKSKSSVGSFVALCRREKIKGYVNKICELGKIIIGYDIK